MTTLYPFTTTEIFFVLAFVLLYLLFLGRTFWLARRLKTSARAAIPKFFLRVSYLSLLFIALLGPSFGVATQAVGGGSRDLFLLVDLSRSMDATDAVPTRLERLKFDLRHLTDSLPGDRFGLIGVADEPILLTPLTRDHNALQQTVQALSTRFGATGGTDLCPAIELARQKLLGDSSAGQAAKGIILFSDGENFGTCDPALLAGLRRYRIPLLSVGVGTSGGSTLREGGGFLRDAEGQVVRTRLNAAFLSELSTRANGRFVQADPEGRYLGELQEVIRGLRSTVVTDTQVAVATNKYYYFLMAAVVLMALDLLVTVRMFRL